MSRAGGGAMTDAPITLADIERLAAEYAANDEALSLENTLLAAEISALIRARMPAIRGRIEAARNARHALKTAIESAPGLFTKPRTRVLSGIKLGFQRLQGGVRYPADKEPAIIAQIKTLWPERVAELVRSAESLLRKGLEKLPAADLRRLGVAVVPPGDVVLTQPQAADPVKTAEAILNAWAPADGAETADA